MSAQFHFHPLVEGYLSYLLEVRRLAPGTLRDQRSSLRKATVHYACIPTWEFILALWESLFGWVPRK